MESTSNSTYFQVTDNEQTYEELIQTVQEKERPISEYIEAQPDLQKEFNEYLLRKNLTNWDEETAMLFLSEKENTIMDAMDEQSIFLLEEL